MQTDPAQYIRDTIRTVPDWPKPGVQFRDITPVLQDPRSFRVLIDLFVYRYMRQRLDLALAEYQPCLRSSHLTLPAIRIRSQ